MFWFFSWTERILRSSRNASHELLGEEDIVIKSLAENYCNVDGIAGASILGDGRVSLILDVAALLEMSTQADHAVVADKEFA